MENLLAEFALLAGVAALISALINLGKLFGFVPDGSAPTVSAVLNFLALGVFVALRLFVPSVDIAGLDAGAQALASFLVAVIAFVGQLGISKASNAALRGTTGIGFSHSLKK